jgi:hypothetical protein
MPPKSKKQNQKEAVSSSSTTVTTATTSSAAGKNRKGSSSSGASRSSSSAAAQQEEEATIVSNNADGNNSSRKRKKKNNSSERRSGGVGETVVDLLDKFANKEYTDLTDADLQVICDVAEINADETVGRRIEASTKKAYDGGIKYIEGICEACIPDALMENEKGEKRLEIPMQLKHMKIFFGIMGAERKDGTLKTQKTIDSYINALKNYYRENNLELGKEHKKFLEEFTDGHKRKVAKKKDEGVMKNFEGKAPIAFQTYCAICKLALFAATARSIVSAFVHTFMILCWNLFARSISVSQLRMCHLTWSNDALVIDLSRHKADQTGEKITPKHIFANPFEPHTCPILATALYLFSYSFRVDEDDKTKLFVKDPYNIFVKWFEVALQSISNLGYSISDFGTHSFRKGVTTYCSGFLGGPTVIAIFLRAGWTLGQVQDRYIGFSDGADQLCGRVACGLNFTNGEEFQVLPPCFIDNGHVLSPEEWEIVSPGYAQFPQAFKTVMPYLLASVVYHYDSFIMAKKDDGTLANISAHHPIFNSPLFRSGLVPRLKLQLLPLNTTGACSISGMKASGIPPHVADNALIRKLSAQCVALEAKMDRYHLENKTELPRNVSAAITEDFVVEGVQQMSKSQFREIIVEEIQSSMNSAFEKYQIGNPSRGAASGNDDSRDMDAVRQGLEYFMITADGYYLWSWDSKLNRPVPRDFVFPRGNVQTLCDLFMFGIPSQRIMPFRKVSCDTLKKADRTYFSRGKAVFNAIVREGVETLLLASEDDVATLSPIQWLTVFGGAYKSLIAKIKTKSLISKVELISYLSVFNYYQAYIKTLQAEVQNE